MSNKLQQQPGKETDRQNNSTLPLWGCQVVPMVEQLPSLSSSHIVARQPLQKRKMIIQGEEVSSGVKQWLLTRIVKIIATYLYMFEIRTTGTTAHLLKKQTLPAEFLNKVQTTSILWTCVRQRQLKKKFEANIHL